MCLVILERRGDVAQIIEVINGKKSERGISLAELSRRTGIEYEALRETLKGKRNLRATEFIDLCIELDLCLSDFDHALAIK